MPYGQFTGYEPLPNGVGYMLQTQGGARFPAVGPEAESIRQKIDAANAAETALARATAPAPPAGIAAPAEQAAPPSATRMFSGKDGSTIALRDGGDPSNPAHWVKTTPGRAGSKGGMAEVARQSQGGYELDPERMRQIQASQDEIQAAREQAAFTAQKSMAERQAYIQAMRDQASKEVVETVRENTIKQQGLDDLRSKYEAAEQDFLATPERQKKDREGKPIKTIAEGIALALGTLGATLARTPNFVAQTIEANRERQLRQEEAELRVKKDAKDSLLGRLRDEMGSMDLAKQAFRAIRTRQDALALEQVAAKTQDAQRVQEIMQLASVENQNYLKYREALERGQQGEISRSYRFAPGQAASGPRQTGVSLEEAAQIADLDAKKAGVAKTEADTGKTRAEIASGGAGGAKLSDTSANSFANIAAVREKLPGLRAASEDQGAMVVDKLPVVGGILDSESSAKYKSLGSGIARLAGKAVEGDAAAESNVKALEADLTSPYPSKRKAAIEALDSILEGKQRAMKSFVPGAPR